MLKNIKNLLERFERNGQATQGSYHVNSGLFSGDTKLVLEHYGTVILTVEDWEHDPVVTFVRVTSLSDTNAINSTFEYLGKDWKVRTIKGIVTPIGFECETVIAGF